MDVLSLYFIDTFGVNMTFVQVLFWKYTLSVCGDVSVPYMWVYAYVFVFVVAHLCVNVCVYVLALECGGQKTTPHTHMNVFLDCLLFLSRDCELKQKEKH